MSQLPSPPSIPARGPSLPVPRPAAPGGARGDLAASLWRRLRSRTAAAAGVRERR